MRWGGTISVLAVWVLGVAHGTSTQNVTCSSPCVYNEDDFSYRCAGLGCQSFPIDSAATGADDATLIDLSYNHIEILSTSDLDFPELVSLDLSNNRLREISNHAFRDCSKVKYLNLSSNSIATLESGTFFSLSYLEILHLDNNLLKLLPDGLFMWTGHLSTLNLGWNSISGFTDAMSSDLRQLSVLHLNNNDLDTIQPHWFDDYKNLQILCFKSNHIREIGNDSFVDLTDLVKLDLSDNQLSSFGFEMFNEGTRPDWALETLLLNDNQISTLVRGTFSPFKNLKSLILDKNPILNIEGNNVLPDNLHNFSMIYNTAIRTIVNGTFSNVQRLANVDFTGCQSLTEIEVGAFRGLETAMDRFDVSECGLTSLPAELLSWPDVTSIYLEGNPWDCDCNLQWMKTSLPDEVTKTVMCRSPRDVKGQSVYSLAMNNFTCTFYSDDAHRHAVGLGLVIAATLVFVVALTGLVYTYRKRLCGAVPKRKRSSSTSNEKGTYQSLYNAVDDDGTSDPTVAITLVDEKTSLKDNPAPTPV